MKITVLFLLTIVMNNTATRIVVNHLVESCIVKPLTPKTCININILKNIIVNGEGSFRQSSQSKTLELLSPAGYPTLFTVCLSIFYYSDDVRVSTTHTSKGRSLWLRFDS